MTEEPPFRTVLRGYDPDQVKSALDELQGSVVSARRMTADRTIELTRMQEQLAKAQQDLEAANHRLAEVTTAAPTSAPSVADVGSRIGSILALANEEAEELRAAGRDDARRRREEADASIAAARADAEREAEQLRAGARRDADRILEEARLRGAEAVDAATRDADAHRAEAQAMLERHRAQAEAVAAFGAQVHRHAERLQQASTRVEQLAQEEAALIRRQAQESAERIRQDTDNQLAAVDARRQSITAQLDTVGTLLQELGRSAEAGEGSEHRDGGAPSNSHGAPADAGTDTTELGHPEGAGARH
jgi:cell division septum initiation protein DivIVA